MGFEPNFHKYELIVATLGAGTSAGNSMSHEALRSIRNPTCGKNALPFPVLIGDQLVTLEF